MTQPDAQPDLLDRRQHDLLVHDVTAEAHRRPQAEQEALLKEIKTKAEDPEAFKEWLRTGGKMLVPDGRVLNSPQHIDRVSAALFREGWHIDSIAAKVSKDVEEKMRSRAMRIERIFFTSLAIVGVIGFGGISAIITIAAGTAAETKVNAHKAIQGLDATILATAQTVVDERIEGVVLRLDDAELYQQLRTLGMVVKSEQEGLPQGTSRAISDVVTEIGEREDVLKNADFIVIMNGIIQKLAAMDSNDTIREITAAVGKLLAQDREICSRLTESYAQMLIADSVPPAQWDAKDVAAFEMYADSISSLGYPENALPWRVMVEVTRAGNERTRHTDRLIEELERLMPVETADAIHTIYYYRRPENWSARLGSPSVTHTRVGDASEVVIGLYGDQFREWMRDSQRASALAEVIRRTIEQNGERVELLVEDLVDLLPDDES